MGRISDLPLMDSILSRILTLKNWRIGHFKRKIPEGYEETLKSGINRIKNSNLARYYDKLALITQGNLLGINRLKAIWEINTGQLNYFVEHFIISYKSK